MSRTKKGAKGPSYDYWSRRPSKSTLPGPYAKRLTHRAERRVAAKTVAKETIES